MMEKTIETVDDRADTEWKFARSRLYMEYIRDGKISDIEYRFCHGKIKKIIQQNRASA